MTSEVLRGTLMIPSRLYCHYIDLLLFCTFRTSIANGIEQIIALPFVYCLLENKNEGIHKKTFEVIKSECDELAYRLLCHNLIW